MAEEQRVPTVLRCPKRVRALLAGHVVVDATRPLLVWEGPPFPTYFFDQADVTARLQATGDHEASALLGRGEVLDVVVEGATAPRAARRYRAAPLEALRGTVRLEWSAMDQWLEEDEPVYTHPRDPYSRIDVLDSSRHVVVEVDDVVVADSHQPRILFETGLPPRYYLPLTDYRTELLRPSTTQTSCPYKGTAGYLHVEVAGRRYEDVLWTYRAPFHDASKVAGLVAPYSERLHVTVDGRPPPPALPHRPLPTR